MITLYPLNVVMLFICSDSATSYLSNYANIMTPTNGQNGNSNQNLNNIGSSMFPPASDNNLTPTNQGTASGMPGSGSMGSTAGGGQMGSSPGAGQMGSSPGGTQTGSTSSGGQMGSTSGGGQTASSPGGGQMGSMPGGGQMGSRPVGGQMGSMPGGGQMGSTPDGGQIGSMSSGGQMGVIPGGGQMGSTQGGGQMGARPGGGQMGSTQGGGQMGARPGGGQMGSTPGGSQIGSTSNGGQMGVIPGGGQMGSTQGGGQMGARPGGGQMGSTPGGGQIGSTSNGGQMGVIPGGGQMGSTQGGGQMGARPGGGQMGSTPGGGQIGSTSNGGQMGVIPGGGQMGSTQGGGQMGARPGSGQMGSTPGGGQMGSTPSGGQMGSRPGSSNSQNTGDVTNVVYEIDFPAGINVFVNITNPGFSFLPSSSMIMPPMGNGVDAVAEPVTQGQVSDNMPRPGQNVNIEGTQNPVTVDNMGQPPSQIQNKMLFETKCEEYYSMGSRKVRKAKVQVFIVGGTNSLPREFPHMAALGYGKQDKKEWLCGGSLISEYYVLTAAHCLTSKTLGEIQFVRLGATDLYTETLDSEDYNVIKRITHPNYNSAEQYNDIALLQLENYVKLSDSIAPICLYPSRNIDQQKLIASGWGKTEATGNVSPELQRVELEYFPNSECQNSYAVVSKQELPRGIIDETQICAGSRNEEKDTCQGDSGGPLQIQESNRAYLVGITSFGIGCGKPGSPGVYTRVAPYIPWIENIVWGATVK